jgi:arylsulfatase
MQVEMRHKNIVLFFVEQWRADCLGYIEQNKAIDTPFLDQLAHESISFTSAYSACPTCIATRACLATGLSPSKHGRIGYKDEIPWCYKDTLMLCLRNGGYQTICAGKTHFYPPRTTLGFEQLLLYDNQHPQQSDYHLWLDRASSGNVRDTAVEVSSNSWVPHPWVYPEYMHSTNWCIDQAIKALELRDPQRPFLLQVGFHRPHPPLDPPIQYYEAYRDKQLPPVPLGDWAGEHDRPVHAADGKFGFLPEGMLDKTRKAYYAQITHADYQIGRLIYWLRRAKWLEDTWIIFISDHGELLGDHNMYSKISPFEGSARVPFIVRPPHDFRCSRDTRCDAPVTHMDIMPTLLELTELPQPVGLEGRSLLPFLGGEDTKWRDYLHGEHAPGEGSEKGWQFVTDGKKKFIWDSVTGQELFFDLEKDPKEKINIVGHTEYAEAATLWRQRLIEVLSQRQEDNLADGKRLIAGQSLPPVRPWLLGR